MSLLLIRHALPDRVDGVAPRDWGLSSAGRQAASDLAAALRDWRGDVGAVWSSTEPKAIETVQPFGDAAGLPVRTDPRLAEVERPWVEGDYAAQAGRYLGGEDLAGWEPQERAAARFGDAVGQTFSGAAAVVATHGLVMTLFLARTVAGLDPVAFWRALTFPDVWELSGRDLRRMPALPPPR